MTFVLHLRLFETFVYKVNKKGQVLEDNTFFRDDPSKKCSCGVSLFLTLRQRQKSITRMLRFSKQCQLIQFCAKKLDFETTN